MAYDEKLAERIRDVLTADEGITEKKMFGGLAFLRAGNMVVAASGQGGILVRVDPDRSDELVDTTSADRAVMRGRPMQGWLRVDSEHVRTQRQLEKWIRLGSECARTLSNKAET
jgi:TfoX/Sxy family transcriptional regulator of competence genes